MKKLQEKLIEYLKGYNFKELEDLLNKNNLPEVRETIMNAMETYYEEEFYKWIEEQ